MIRITSPIVFVATLSLISRPAHADDATIELGAPFSDNMVLQREMAVPVWGCSKAGT